jgi:hypothetical protein
LIDIYIGVTINGRTSHPSSLFNRPEEEEEDFTYTPSLPIRHEKFFMKALKEHASASASVWKEEIISDPLLLSLRVRRSFSGEIPSLELLRVTAAS